MPGAEAPCARVLGPVRSVVGDPLQAVLPPGLPQCGVPCETGDGVSDPGLCVIESTRSLRHPLGCREPSLSSKLSRLRTSQAPGLGAIEGGAHMCPKRRLVVGSYRVCSSDDFWLEGGPEVCFRARLVGGVFLPSFLPKILFVGEPEREQG